MRTFGEEKEIINDLLIDISIMYLNIIGIYKLADEFYRVCFCFIN